MAISLLVLITPVTVSEAGTGVDVGTGDGAGTEGGAIIILYNHIWSSD